MDCSGLPAIWYAAGVTLYEMLTGTKPFSSDTPWATLAKIQRGERPHLRELIPNVDPLLEEVIETAMDASPQRRYKSAGDMAAVLASKPITNRQSKARVVDLDRLGVSDPTRLMEPAASNETVLMGTPARVEAPPSPWASRSGVLRNPMVLLAGLAAVVLIVLGVFAMADGGGSVPVNNPEPVAERQVAPSEDISDQELRDALDTLRSAVRL
jgi:serine/threonine protein kinase